MCTMASSLPQQESRDCACFAKRRFWAISYIPRFLLCIVPLHPCIFLHILGRCISSGPVELPLLSAGIIRVATSQTLRLFLANGLVYCLAILRAACCQTRAHILANETPSSHDIYNNNNTSTELIHGILDPTIHCHAVV